MTENGHFTLLKQSISYSKAMQQYKYNLVGSDREGRHVGLTTWYRASPFTAEPTESISGLNYLIPRTFH